MNRNAVPSALCLALLLAAAPAAAGEEAASWVEKSNAHAAVLLDVLARFSPEQAAQFGIEGLDEEVSTFPPDVVQRQIAAVEDARSELERRLAAEEHPLVRQDLEIMTEAAGRFARSARVNDRNFLPYTELPLAIFLGFRGLLDDRVAEERRPAALVRLRRYAGMEEGYTPIAEQLKALISARFDEPELLGPGKAEVEQHLGNSPRYVAGIRQLFEKYGLEGYEEAYAALERQLADWDEWVRREILPRAREDFRLPPEIYALNLEQAGVDMPVEELVSRANVAFREIQNEMQALAGLLARERGYESSDYRDVIRRLKEDQLEGEAILAHYQKRIGEIERLIERHGILTLPERDMRIRLASEAESAAIPAPNMQPPRLLGNTGEVGEFVLPLRIPDREGKEEVAFDDFTFEAASWTLTAHEGRPGHELQFTALVEGGISQARVLFAFNSTNVEGWALYAEAEMKPYEPLDGQLIALQGRLLRAARAILDPGVQGGTITPEEATRVLVEEVVMSPAMAQQEVERYMFRAPGQATSYFCGYTRLMEMRAEVERLLAGRFDRRAYHDFLLAQGLLPPRLLRKAVIEEFVPRGRAGATTAP